MALEYTVELAVHVKSLRNLELIRKGLYRLHLSIHELDSRLAASPMPYMVAAAPTRLGSFAIGSGAVVASASGSEHGRVCGPDDAQYCTRSMHIRFNDEMFELDELSNWRLRLQVPVPCTGSLDTAASQNTPACLVRVALQHAACAGDTDVPGAIELPDHGSGLKLHRTGDWTTVAARHVGVRIQSMALGAVPVIFHVNALATVDLSIWACITDRQWRPQLAPSLHGSVSSSPGNGAKPGGFAKLWQTAKPAAGTASTTGPAERAGPSAPTAPGAIGGGRAEPGAAACPPRQLPEVLFPGHGGSSTATDARVQAAHAAWIGPAWQAALQAALLLHSIGVSPRSTAHPWGVPDGHPLLVCTMVDWSSMPAALQAVLGGHLSACGTLQLRIPTTQYDAKGKPAMDEYEPSPVGSVPAFSRASAEAGTDGAAGLAQATAVDCFGMASTSPQSFVARCAAREPHAVCAALQQEQHAVAGVAFAMWTMVLLALQNSAKMLPCMRVLRREWACSVRRVLTQHTSVTHQITGHASPPVPELRADGREWELELPCAGLRDATGTKPIDTLRINVRMPCNDQPFGHVPSQWITMATAQRAVAAVESEAERAAVQVAQQLQVASGSAAPHDMPVFQRADTGQAAVAAMVSRVESACTTSMPPTRRFLQRQMMLHAGCYRAGESKSVPVLAAPTQPAAMSCGAMLPLLARWVLQQSGTAPAQPAGVLPSLVHAVVSQCVSAMQPGPARRATETEAAEAGRGGLLARVVRAMHQRRLTQMAARLPLDVRQAERIVGAMAGRAVELQRELSRTMHGVPAPRRQHRSRRSSSPVGETRPVTWTVRSLRARTTHGGTYAAGLRQREDTPPQLSDAQLHLTFSSCGSFSSAASDGAHDSGNSSDNDGLWMSPRTGLAMESFGELSTGRLDPASISLTVPTASAHAAPAAAAANLAAATTDVSDMVSLGPMLDALAWQAWTECSAEQFFSSAWRLLQGSPGPTRAPSSASVSDVWELDDGTDDGILDGAAELAADGAWVLPVDAKQSPWIRENCCCAVQVAMYMYTTDVVSLAAERVLEQPRASVSEDAGRASSTASAGKAPGSARQAHKLLNYVAHAAAMAQGDVLDRPTARQATPRASAAKVSSPSLPWYVPERGTSRWVAHAVQQQARLLARACMPGLVKMPTSHHTALAKAASLWAKQAVTPSPPMPSDVAPEHGVHVVILQSGMSGNVHDTRLLRAHLKLYFPQLLVCGLKSNQDERTDDGLLLCAERAAIEIDAFISRKVFMAGYSLGALSFIGFSLGGCILRVALRHAVMAQYLPRLHTFMSIATPHLGIAHGQSSVFDAGLYFVRKFRRNQTLEELALRDASTPSAGLLPQLCAGVDGAAHAEASARHLGAAAPYHVQHIVSLAQQAAPLTAQQLAELRAAVQGLVASGERAVDEVRVDEQGRYVRCVSVTGAQPPSAIAQRASALQAGRTAGVQAVTASMQRMLSSIVPPDDAAEAAGMFSDSDSSGCTAMTSPERGRERTPLRELDLSQFNDPGSPAVPPSPTTHPAAPPVPSAGTSGAAGDSGSASAAPSAHHAAVSAQLHQSNMWAGATGTMLRYFQRIVLVGSPQDRYVPLHSTLAQLPIDGRADPTLAAMLDGFWEGVDMRKVRRCTVQWTIPRKKVSVDSMIGREAHLAFLESRAFVTWVMAVLSPCWQRAPDLPCSAASESGPALGNAGAGDGPAPIGGSIVEGPSLQLP